ncbi:TMV resistance protein N [Vitis vinifera]|uniref:ADP-ribosyl cyclase/cyclic ADP-ribose hydrolase n=1 Tax=Vitis vinifera TaxID=29760 RepID=A0A438DCK1_VITVI|nr:TMV resistance protein N [Vitis vinifera]
MTPTSPISFILIIFVTNSNLMYLMIDRHEAEVIQKIREVIITRLNRKPLYVGDNIVGMDFHLKQLKSLVKTELDDVHMVGIYGIGGIGKTTIAMAFYNDISSRFDGSSFLRGVGEKSKGGLLELQKKLFKDILKCESTDFDDTSEGINGIKKRLCSKRVLIVLDDVEELEQLENLAGKNGWYGAKSTIIITTKDTSLLSQHGVNILYEVKELNHKEAIDLFNWWAFKQNIPKPKEDFESLSHCVVGYAKGLPIALKVLGGFLFGKKIDEWKSALHKLEKIPHMKVQSVLKVSYERLDDTEKEIFLDIACFFKGKDKDLVSRILGRYADIGIKVLHERCLITISQNKLDMHDLLQQMGQEIVRQECLKEPGKRSRLWDSNDVDSMLTRNTGTEAIEGLFVEIPTSNKMQFSTNSFTKMNRLRLFIVYNKRYWNCFKGDFEFPSSQLRYLNFYGCSLESLPTNFNGRNLVELDLVRSGIKKLWKGDEIFNSLKVINLGYSKYLVEIPDFSSVPNLEILNLEGCTSLESFPKIKENMSKLREINLSGTAIIEVPSSIEHLNGLEYFNLSGCFNLVSLPRSICNLSSLQTLYLDSCSKLKGFPEMKDNMGNLERLNLRFTAIEELSSSVGHLKALKHLDLSFCKNLVNLPESIFNISSLETLNGSMCLKIKDFPEIKNNMGNLERLDLSFTAIEELPYSIGYLKALKDLDLSYCHNLVNLPESICNLSSLEKLRVRNCPKLQRLEVNLEDGSHILRSLNTTCCIIKQGVIWSNGRFSSLETLHLRCSQMEGEILNHHIWSLSSLVELCIRNSDLTGRGILSDSFYPSSLVGLSVGNFNLMEVGDKGESNDSPLSVGIQGILNDIWNLSSLVKLSLNNCNLMEVGILSDIWNLSSLHTCWHQTTFQSKSPQLETLQEASRNSRASIKFKRPLLEPLQKARAIPELPSNLLLLDMHSSDGISSLSNHSLLNCLKSKLYQELQISLGASEFRDMAMEIVIPRSSGILEGTRNQSMGSHQVRIELPQNCASDLVWVIYYPKDAIKKQYLSNQWTHFTASFKSVTLEAKECGIHPIYGCFKCRRDKECQQKLCLKGSAINELPFIESPFELGSLCLRECKNLESLPSTICELKSLTTLSCSGCSQLTIFPEIFETLENLRELHLEGTAIEELPSSIQHLRGLQYLNLAYCNNLVSLPETIYRLKSLVFLSCTGCSQLKSFPEILENIENLRELSLHGTAIKELPTSIERLGGLQDLHLSNCSNLVNLPESICNLRFLKNLNVNLCSKLEKFPQNLGSLQRLELLGAAGSDSNRVLGAIQSDDCRMSSWKALNLSINYFSSIIPISIIQLSKLRVLDLSHCQKLLQIPELPPSLRILDVHACPCLETLSRIECGSYWSKEIQIVIPGNNGIPEWISQRKKGSEITIELPMDWYHNNDFLGVALYSVYVPLHIESNEDPCSLKCQLNFHVHHFEFLDDLPSKFWSMNGLSYEFWPVDELSFRRGYLCHHNGDELNEVRVAYYPKVAIPNQYWSNKWRHLKASFHGYLGSKQVKVKECGFHLISMPKIVNRSIPQDRSIKGVEHNRPPILIQYPDVQRCCDTKSVPEDTNVNAQSCCDDTHSTEHNHSPMDTITHNVDDNVVDAQDEEEDHMHK